MTKFKQILREDDTNDPEEIEKIGRNWLKRWMKDNRISNKRKTNRKAKSVYERLHQISNYHHFVIYNMANPEKEFPVWNNTMVQEYGSDIDEAESDTASESEDTEEQTT